MKKLLFIFIFSSYLFSQDFGYTYYNLMDYRALGVSYNLQNFSPAASSALPDSFRIRFKTNLPFIEYREVSSRIAVGYQEYVLGGRTLSSFSVYLESANDFPITGREHQNGIFIPVKLSANYVKAASPYPGQRNFDVGSIGVGAGLKYRYLSQKIGLQAAGMGAIHFSNVGFGIEYGSQTSLTGEIQLIIPEFFYNGMIIGYRYDFQQWNMNDTLLNYRRYYHGPFIGIFF